MKTFLVVLGLLLMFISGGATMFFGDARYFETHTGGITLTNVYDAEQDCESRSMEHCFMTGGFLPDSYLDEKKFPVDQGI